MKKVVIILFALYLLSQNIFAQSNNISNIDCTNAFELAQDSIRNVQTFDLTQSNDPNLLTYYSFVAQTNNIKIVSNWWGVNTLNVDSCNSTQTIVSNSSYYNSPQSDSLIYSLKFTNLVVGKKYFFQIKGNYKKFKVSIENFIPETYTNCTNPITISQNDTIKPITTDIRNTLSNDNSNFPVVWYKFKANTPIVKISSSEYGSNSDIYLLDSCGGVQKKHSKYESFYNNNKIKYEYLFKELIIGKEYLIRLRSNNSLEVTVAVSGFHPAANDICEQAKQIKYDSVYTDSITYSTENSLWYKFIATSNNIVIEPQNNSYFTALLSDSCGGNYRKPSLAETSRGGILFDSLQIGQSYQILLSSSFSKYISFALFDFSPLTNDECSGAIEIIPSNTFVAQYADLESATFSNKNEIYGISDVWYSFVATSTNMTIKAYPSDEKTSNSLYGVELTLYDSCNSNPISSSFVNFGDQNSYVDITNNYFKIGQRYFYKIAALKWIFGARLANPTPSKFLFKHGVVSNSSDINDTIDNAYCLGLNSNITLSSNKFRKGRRNLSNSNCTNGIKDEHTIEAYFKLCDLSDYGDFGVKFFSKNRKLIYSVELLDSVGVNSLQTCSKGGSLNILSPIDTTMYNVHGIDHINVITYLRCEISDTSASPSDFEFGVLTYQNFLGGVETIENNNSFNFYPNPSKGEVNIEFENEMDRKISIFNFLGQEIETINTSNKNYQLHLKSGIYLIKVETKESNLTSKLIVE